MVRPMVVLKQSRNGGVVMSNQQIEVNSDTKKLHNKSEKYISDLKRILRTPNSPPVYFCGTGTTTNILPCKREIIYIDGKEESLAWGSWPWMVAKIYEAALGKDNCPDIWEGAMEDHADKAQKEYLKNNSSDQDAWFKICQEIITESERNFENKHYCPELGYFLAKTGRPILTTNYDSLLSKFTGYMPVSYDGVMNFLNNIEYGTDQILHLHGTISDTNKLVFDKETYEDRMNDSAYITSLKKLFQENDVILLGVGAGLQDAFFKEFLKKLFKDYKPSENNKNIYWLNNKGPAEKYHNLFDKNSDLDKMTSTGMIRPIFFEGHQNLTNFLESLYVDFSENYDLGNNDIEELNIDYKNKITGLLKDKPIVTICADGGFGKTILSKRVASLMQENYCLRQKDKEKYANKPRVFFHSFYKQGETAQYDNKQEVGQDEATQAGEKGFDDTRFNDFFDEALKFFSEKEENIALKDVASPGQKLAELMAKTVTPAIIILDGMEVALRSIWNHRIIADSRIYDFLNVIIEGFRAEGNRFNKYENVRVILTSREIFRNANNEEIDILFENLSEIRNQDIFCFLRQLSLVNLSDIELVGRDGDPLRELVSKTGGVALHINILANILKENPDLHSANNQVFLANLSQEIDGMSGGGVTFLKFQYERWMDATKDPQGPKNNLILLLLSIFDRDLLRSDFVEYALKVINSSAELRYQENEQEYVIDFSANRDELEKALNSLIALKYVDETTSNTEQMLGCHPVRRVFYRDILGKDSSLKAELHNKYASLLLSRLPTGEINKNTKWQSTKKNKCPEEWEIKNGKEKIKDLWHEKKQQNIEAYYKTIFLVCDHYLHAENYELAYETYLAHLEYVAFGQGLIYELLSLLLQFFDLKKGQNGQIILTGIKSEAQKQLIKAQLRIEGQMGRLDLSDENRLEYDIYQGFLHDKRQKWCELPKEVSHFLMSIGRINLALEFENNFKNSVLDAYETVMSRTLNNDEVLFCKKHEIDHYIRLTDLNTYGLQLEAAKRAVNNAEDFLKEDGNIFQTAYYDYWKMILHGKAAHVCRQMGEEADASEEQKKANNIFDKLVKIQSEEILYKKPHVIFQERAYHDLVTDALLKGDKSCMDQFDAFEAHMEKQKNRRAYHVLNLENFMLYAPFLAETGQLEKFNEAKSYAVGNGKEQDKLDKAGKLNFKIQFYLSTILVLGKIREEGAGYENLYKAVTQKIEDLLSLSSYSFYFIQFHCYKLYFEKSASDTSQYDPDPMIDFVHAKWHGMAEACNIEKEKIKLSDLLTNVNYGKMSNFYKQYIL